DPVERARVAQVTEPAVRIGLAFEVVRYRVDGKLAHRAAPSGMVAWPRIQPDNRRALCSDRYIHTDECRRTGQDGFVHQQHTSGGRMVNAMTEPAVQGVVSSREAILDAAAALMARNGFAATSISRISTACGL